MLKSHTRVEASGIVVFTGPSLHPREARTILDATYLPPVKRGDVDALLASKPRAVGLIDGEFYQSLAVAPKEVLRLIESGVRVYGAASMGALRAAELCRYGMIGVGSVFRLFRRGLLDADDEVALAYAPDTFQPQSEPLVNARYALRAAVRRGILKRTEALKILSTLKSVYFPERTRDLLMATARARMGNKRARALADFLASEAPNVKQRDALLMLDRIRRDLRVAKTR